MAHLNDTYLRSVNIDLISSGAETSYSDTHKVFFLPGEIRTPPNVHMLIGLSHFSMIYSWFQFRAGVNDSFDLTIGGTTITITIPEGNYNVPEFVAALNTLLTTANITFALSVLSISANYTTNKCYISTTPANAITISNNLMWKEMGMASSASLAFSSSTQHYMPYIFNLAGDSAIYIRLQNQQIKNMNTENVDGIMAIIPVSSMYGEYIFYMPQDIQYFRTQLNLSSLEMSILDENMQPIASLNTSTSWRATFSVHFSYNKKIEIAEEHLINNKDNALLSAPNIDKKK